MGAKTVSEYYLYQCAGCAITLYGDCLPEGEQYTSVMNGALCESCQYQQDEEGWSGDN